MVYLAIWNNYRESDLQANHKKCIINELCFRSQCSCKPFLIHLSLCRFDSENNFWMFATFSCSTPSGHLEKSARCNIIYIACLVSIHSYGSFHFQRAWLHPSASWPARWTITVKQFSPGLSLSHAHAQKRPPPSHSQVKITTADEGRLQRDQKFISFAANFSATRGE